MAGNIRGIGEDSCYNSSFPQPELSSALRLVRSSVMLLIIILAHNVLLLILTLLQHVFRTLHNVLGYTDPQLYNYVYKYMYVFIYLHVLTQGYQKFLYM